MWVKSQQLPGRLDGMLLLGYFSTQLGLLRLIKWYFFGCMLAIVAFSFAGADWNLIRLLAVATGFFVYGGIAGLFATAARSYPAHIRTTGVGWAIGIGRIGSTVSPAFAGLLFAAGLATSAVYWIYAIPPLLGFIRIPKPQGP